MMAQKIPGSWELHAEGVTDADGQFIVWNNQLGEVAMSPEAERLIMAAPEMLKALK